MFTYWIVLETKFSICFVSYLLYFLNSAFFLLILSTILSKRLIWSAKVLSSRFFCCYFRSEKVFVMELLLMKLENSSDSRK
jgi:hypothetical protein